MALKVSAASADEMVVKHFDNRNPRFATIKPSSPGSQMISCLFGEVNGKRLALEAETAIATCKTVTVEYNDAMFLGEVIVCRPEAGAFSIEIKVEQVLSGLQSLMALRSQLLCEGAAKMPMAASSVSNATQTFA